MDAIFQSVWEMSLFAIPVILVLALSSKFLGKRYGARWRYLLWLVVAVRLCIPVQFSLPDFMMEMRMEVPSVQNGTRAVLETKNPEYLAQSDADKAQMEEFMGTLSEADGYMLHVDFGVPDDHDFFDFFLAYPDMLWMLGILLFFVWQGWKYHSFKKMLQRNRRKVMDAAVLDCFYILCRENDGTRIVVGMATCGIAAGARPVLTTLVERVASKKYDAAILQTGCIGMCKLEPMVEVYEGDKKTTYVLVDAKKAKKIADYHLGKGEVVDEYTIGHVTK